MLRGIVWVVAIVFLVAGCAKKEEAQTTIELPEIFNTEMATQTNLVLMGAQNPAAGATNTAVSDQPQAPAPQAVFPITSPTNEDIQKALKNANLYSGKIDGEIGPKTKKAIRTFQEQNSLKADGKVGPKTWEKLQPLLNAPAAVDFSQEELGE